MRPADMFLIAIAIGLVLFGGSFVYPQWSGAASSKWTDADAQEYVELSRKIHALDHQHSSQRARDPDAQPSPEMMRVADSYLQKRQQLEKAQRAGTGIAAVMFYLGIALVVIGGFCYLATRGSGES